MHVPKKHFGWDPFADPTKNDQLSIIQRDADEDEPNEIAAFPLESYPTVLRCMAQAISDSVCVPIALSAPIVLVTLSAGIGKNLQVKSGADIFSRANLYYLGFAESGTGKSLSSNLATRPIFEFEKDRLSYWSEITYPELTAEYRILGKEITALEELITKKKKDPSEVDRQQLKEELTEKIRAYNEVKDKLKEPRVIIEDATSEAAALKLQQNREQAFSMSSDAGQVIQNIEGRYSKNKTPDDSIYVKAFTGDRHYVDRVSRPPITLDSPCLTVLWLTQPDKAVRLLENTPLSDGGLLPRYLMNDTRAEPTENDDDEKPIPDGVRKAYHDLIHLVLKTYWESEQLLTIPDSPEAAQVIKSFRKRMVPRRQSDLRDVNHFIARWHEQAWRVVVVLHVAIFADKAHLNPISSETAQNAVAIVEWFGKEQLRMLSVMRIFKDEERLERLIRILTLQYNGASSLRNLERRNNYKPEELRRLAQVFPGRIVIEQTGSTSKGGRPSEIVKTAP